MEPSKIAFMSEPVEDAPVPGSAGARRAVEKSVGGFQETRPGALSIVSTEGMDFFVPSLQIESEDRASIERASVNGSTVEAAVSGQDEARAAGGGRSWKRMEDLHIVETQLSVASMRPLRYGSGWDTIVESRLCHYLASILT